MTPGWISGLKIPFWYLMDRFTGQIILKKGPCMLLPDPRKEIVVRRILDPKLVELWFPGNPEALEYNRRLILIANQGKTERTWR
jgi:hypothetical protein